MILNRRRQQSEGIPLFNPKNYEYNYEKKKFDDSSPMHSPEHRRFSMFPKNDEHEGFQ